MSAITTVSRRLKQVWEELDYAQRRSLELRTGVPLTRTRRQARREIAELEPADALDPEQG